MQDISSIWRSLYSALLQDLEPIKEYKRIWSFEDNKQILDKENPVYRRPYEHEVEVYSFPQSWSDTTMGFGGVGGQAFTSGQTTVITHGGNACVYVSGRLAYKIDWYNQKFLEDLGNHQMRGAREGKSVYEGKKPE